MMSRVEYGMESDCCCFVSNKVDFVWCFLLFKEIDSSDDSGLILKSNVRSSISYFAQFRHYDNSRAEGLVGITEFFIHRHRRDSVRLACIVVTAVAVITSFI